MHTKLENCGRGFTLVELLVVIAIISILMGITIPAVQSMRATASNARCRSNLRQIGDALTNYYSNFRSLPASFKVPPGTTVRGSWSVHGRIMPFCELDNAQRRVNLDEDWHLQDRDVTALAYPLFNCPSEVNSETRVDALGQAYVHGTNYGFNMGSWFIHDPVTGDVGDGPFVVNGGRRYTDGTDGMSNTLAAADVKAYTPYIRNVNPIDPTFPTTTDHFMGVVGELKLGPATSQNTGHTVWCDGRVHHTGFTTVFRPNTVVEYESGGEKYDIDYTSQQEGRDLNRPTFAAVTARSFHPGGINALLLDGGTRFVSDAITIEVWQALGSVNGDEVIAESF